MKNLFYIATLLLPLLTIAQTESKIINADIRGHACSGGFGLCSIQAPLDTSLNKTTTPKLLVSRQSENSFVLEMDQQQLTESDQKSLVRKSMASISAEEKVSFVQESDLIIDGKTLIYLGIDVKYNILKAGNYPMVITSDKIRVSLVLSEK